MLKVGKYLNDIYGVDIDCIDKLGAFDAFLDEDSLLFVDPILIKKNKIPEFDGAYDYFLNHFRNIIKLLVRSHKKSDKLWMAASKLLEYKEKPEFGLGFTGKGRSGSGIGPKIRDNILDTISVILENGIDDPVIFELIGTFEEGVGADRISDMTCSILYEYFLLYTQSILQKVGIDLTKKVESKLPGVDEINVLDHPLEDGRYIVLCPKDFLRDLLVSEELGNFSYMVDHSKEMREKLNSELGKDWQKEVSKYKKDNFKEYLEKYSDVLGKFLEEYKSNSTSPYDLKEDYRGLYRWYDDAVLMVQTMGTPDQPYQITDHMSFKTFIEFLINNFADFIENKGMWTNLYRDEKTFSNPHRESYVQNLFRACSHLYCEICNIDLSPEVNGGGGPVDFKLSRGTQFRAIVEIKKSTNPKLLNCVEGQVLAYQKANNADMCFVITVEVNKKPTLTANLKKYIADLVKQKKQHPYMYYVDGMPKVSSSNIKVKKKTTIKQTRKEKL